MKFKKKFVDLPFDGDSIPDGANRKLIHPVTQSIQGLKSFAAYPLASALPEASGDLVTKGRIDAGLAALPVTHAYTFPLTEEMLSEKRATLPIEITGNPLATRLKVEGSAGFIGAVAFEDESENGFLVKGSTLDWSGNTQIFRARAGDMATVLYSGLAYVPAGTQVFTHFEDDTTMHTFDYWRIFTSVLLDKCTDASCLGLSESAIFYYPENPDMEAPYYCGALIATPQQAIDSSSEWGFSCGGVFNTANNRRGFAFRILVESISNDLVARTTGEPGDWVGEMDLAYDWYPIQDSLLISIVTPSTSSADGQYKTGGTWSVCRGAMVKRYPHSEYTREYPWIADGSFSLSDFPVEDGIPFAVGIENTGGTLEVSITINSTKHVLYSQDSISLQPGVRGIIRQEGPTPLPYYYGWNGSQYVGSPICMIDWLNFVMQ